MGLTFEGNKAFFTKIKAFSQASKEIVQEELTVSIDEIYNNAMINSPADMGAGGGIRSSGYKEVTEFEGEVGFRNNYAPYLEFGTGTKVQIPAGLEDYAMEFYVNGQGRLPAKPFLFPAFFKESGEFLKRVSDQIGKEWGK